MLISLDDNAKHLTRLQALLIDQTLTDAQQLGERVLHNLVKLLALLSCLETVNTANSQQALQTCVHGVRIVGTQELKSQIEETRPLLGEIVLQDLLEKGDQLGADIGGRRGQGRDQSLAEAGLLSLGNWDTLGVVFDGDPSSVDTVLQVDAS